MKVMTFPEMTDVKEGETVIFAFVTYKSREHRDEVNEKVMQKMKEHGEEDMDMPFDIERMACGGFETIVSL